MTRWCPELPQMDLRQARIPLRRSALAANPTPSVYRQWASEVDLTHSPKQRQLLGWGVANIRLKEGGIRYTALAAFRALAAALC